MVDISLTLADQVLLMSQVITWFMWMGIIPAALFGLFISHLRLRHMTVIVPERFR